MSCIDTNVYSLTTANLVPGLDKSVLDERVKTLTILATVGHGLELTCGIIGVKDVIWKRHGVDVNALHMDDISVSTCRLGSYQDGGYDNCKMVQDLKLIP